MIAGDLLAIIRADYLDDEVGQQAWTDTFLLREIGRSQQQACYRQDLKHLFDAESDFAIQLEADVQAYALHPLILRIERASYDGDDLVHTTRHELDTFKPSWRSAIPGYPRRFYIVGRTLYLDRAPSAAEDGLELSLDVWREPLIAPTDLAEDDELEWPTDQEQLAHWVCYRAYFRRDEDRFDAPKAADHLALFNATFGEEVPAQVRANLLQYPDSISFGPVEPMRRVAQESW